jgi:putative ABC transport system ATP-binding protein
MSLFEACNVCKYFRRGTAAEVRALDDVSLALPQGSFTLLTGPSGSGKTTLLALLGALDRPSAGHICFAGQDLARLSDVGLARVRRRLGFVFQDFSLIPGLPVWENITYPLIPRGRGPAARYETACLLLARLRLADKLTARPKELSGGELQRVAVARALAGQPEVLLADEPTSNLDPAAAGELVALLQGIHAEGKTVIVSSHDPQLVSLATQVCRLEAGRLRSDSL